MRNTLTLYRREIGAYFNSVIAYIFIVLFLLFLSFVFFFVNRFFAQPQPVVTTYFAILPYVYIIFIPAVTMRLWSEEKRAGTIELLMTMPLKSWEIVLAKYLAGYTIVLISLFCTLVVPLSLTLVTDFDPGVIFCTYVGAALIASVYIAIGAWVSTFTRNQIVALLISVLMCFFVTFFGAQPLILQLNKLVDGFGNFVAWFGTTYHFQEFSKGLLSPVGVIYSVSTTAFFLILNNVFVEGRKY